MGMIRDIRTKFPETHTWRDSCTGEDLKWSIEHGVVGATTNPVTVGSVLKQELLMWEGRICELLAKPEVTGDEVAWELIREMGIRGVGMPQPLFEESNGRYGHLSIQTNTKNYKNAGKMMVQAAKFSKLAPNMQVKTSVPPVGIKAFEETTYQGANINVTVSFSVAQAMKVVEAVEQGLERRREKGLEIEHMIPVCIIMIGRIDDRLKKVVKRDNIAIDSERLEWAGAAMFRHAYEIFEERGYQIRLLAATYRNHYAWSALMGGRISTTLTRYYLEQMELNGFEIKESMSAPVSPELVTQLKGKLPDPVQAYEEDGMKEEEFEHYGAFITCLEGFFKGYDDLLQMIRPYQLGKPIRE